jgi:FkbM family methyltransferase
MTLQSENSFFLRPLLWILFKGNMLRIKIRAIGLLPLLYLYLFPHRKGKSIDLVIYGTKIHLRPRSHDFYVSMTTLGGEFNLIQTVFPPDFNGVILDAGGYIGTAAIAFSKMYPQAKIVSLEPAKENFDLLKRNTLNFPNIIPIHSGISVDGLPITLYNRDEGEWSFSVLPKTSNGAPVVYSQIPSVTLEKITERYGPISCIKLDIEGYEKTLFESEASTLKHIPVVFVELHEDIAPGVQAAFDHFNTSRYCLKDQGEKYLSLLHTHNV